MELYQNEHFQMGNDNENLQIVTCYIDTRNHELTHSGQNKMKDMIQLTLEMHVIAGNYHNLGWNITDVCSSELSWH